VISRITHIDDVILDEDLICLGCSNSTEIQVAHRRKAMGSTSLDNLRCRTHGIGGPHTIHLLSYSKFTKIQIALL
jgi:hypothetical protein